MNEVKTLIGAIRDEALGYSMAEPWRPSDSAITCVVPIIRADAKKEPNYLVLAKADVEIKDTGGIERVLIKNNSKLPVFIRMGEVLKGATQERAVTFSQLIFPGETKEVEVKCVHRSRPITTGAKMQSWGYSPGKDNFYGAANFERSSRTTGLASGGVINQTMSWAGDVSYFQEAVLTASSVDNSIKGLRSDDSTALRDRLTKTFDEILKQVPLLDNQVGMALIDKEGLHSLDCFNLHAPWKDVKEAIVGKEVLAIAKTDDEGVFVYCPEKSKGVVKSVLESGFSETEVFSDKNGKTIALDFSNYVGEAVILDDEVIHLLIARKEV